ncbi:ribosomal protein L10 [Nitzschia inconspicua]|uniref:Ribosome assembly factor mrt4 n=1 Tax=Nitzschia inconspicua TaxID=303405 RepID=A0A9K3LEB1_9STRA|nr:ribosomal protein L10 [Nitzschia inconspicua]
MPRSKRSRPVSLTKTSKRATREHKSAYVQEVRDAIDNHNHVFLFSFENMRSNKFKDIRMHFRPTSMDDGPPTRIFLGKNKLMQIALGKTPEDEYSDNLRHVSSKISESVGLLCTSRSKEEVVEYFHDLVEPDFARAGFVAPKDVYITNEMLSHHPVSMLEQQFRKQGLPVKIDNGKIVLLDGKTEHRLCKEGETLSPEKCKALSHFGIKLSEFRVQLVCHWSKNGEFTDLS